MMHGRRGYDLQQGTLHNFSDLFYVNWHLTSNKHYYTVESIKLYLPLQHKAD